MKKLFLFVTFFIITTSLQADDEDDFDNDFFTDSNVDDFAQCNATPLQVVELLTGPDVLLQNFLEQNFYLRTNPVTVRPLFDLPTLHPLRLDLCVSNDRLSIMPFYQQMRKCFLSPCSPYLNSYLAITSPDFLTEIERVAEHFNETLPSITSIFPLFATIKLEERRTGLMFTYQWRHNCFEWRAQFPLYYIEHNFYLNKQEQQAIENSPLMQQLSSSFGGETGQQEVEDFFKLHLVNDLFGFGDLYQQFLWDIAANECFDMQLGFELILPTSIILKKGLIGKGFSMCPSQPVFNWFEIFCLLENNQTEATQEIGEAFAIGALDRLTEVAGHTQLGIGHVTVGFLAESFLTVGDNVGWHNELRVRYICPGNENRFFRNVKTNAEFVRDWANENDAFDNLTFLNQQTVLFLYPIAARVRTEPGIITEFSTALEYQHDCLHVHAGYDIWHQGREFIRSLATSNCTLIPLDFQAGAKSAALQQKVFGRVMFDFIGYHFDWHLGLFADATLGILNFQSTRGIGEDWTAGIDFSMFF